MIIITIIWTKHAIGDICPGVHVHCTIEYHNNLVVTEERRGRGRGKGEGGSKGVMKEEEVHVGRKRGREEDKREGGKREGDEGKGRRKERKGGGGRKNEREHKRGRDREKREGEKGKE